MFLKVFSLIAGVIIVVFVFFWQARSSNIRDAGKAAHQASFKQRIKSQAHKFTQNAEM